jgi:hypothetical protein
MFSQMLYRSTDWDVSDFRFVQGVFVPSGYVFSIWGLIYLGLIAFAIYQGLSSQRNNQTINNISVWFVVSCVANIAWIFLWHYQLFAWTLVAMLLLLVSLIVIYTRLGTVVSADTAAQKWMVRVPFSVYLGWISVATIANVTDVLYFFHWSGWGLAPQTWAAVMLGVGVLLAALVAFTRHDAAYLLVLVWAFIGIALKFPSELLVSISAWLAAAVVAALAIFSLMTERRVKLSK